MSSKIAVLSTNKIESEKLSPLFNKEGYEVVLYSDAKKQTLDSILNTSPDIVLIDLDLETAALRVFSNAEGSYGSNVNQMVDSSAFGNEDELADAYEARKSFAYGVNGKPAQNANLLQKVL